MPKIESEKIDCLHRPCSRPAPQGKIKSVRTHSEVIEQFDSFSLLKLLFLVRNWHCWSRKAFTRQMTPQIREETAKTAVFRQRWQAWKVVRSMAAVRQRPRTPRNWRCSFAFFESFLWHFNKKQHAEVIFRLSRPVLCKNREAQWPIGYGVGLRIKRSSVRIRPWPLRWVLGQGSLLPLSQGEAFTLASISYLAILVKYILAKNQEIGSGKQWSLHAPLNSSSGPYRLSRTA